MSNYVPSKLFKFVPRPVMKQVFEKCGVAFPFPGEDTILDKSASMAAAWMAHRAEGYGGQNLVKLDAALQDIHDVGTAKSDINVILEDLRTEEGHSLPDGFLDLNNYEKAARIFLSPEYGTLWQHMLCILEVKECGHTGRWHEYTGIDCDLDNLDSRRDIIGDVVKDFFWEKKRSEHCRVEIFRKSGNMSYIFAELDDTPEYDEMKHRGEKDFEVWQIVHPFRVVIACDREKGTLGFSANVGKREVRELALDLIYAVKGGSGSVRKAGGYRYNPNRFLYNRDELSIIPGDGFSRCQIKSITVVPWLNKHLRATFSGNISCNPVEQAIIYMKHSGYNENSFFATDVKMELSVSGSRLKKETVNMKISDDGCSTIHLPDNIRGRVESLLDRWEVRRHA